MGRNEIEGIVNESIDQLIKNQSELLDVNITERALCHHLAIYIAERIPSHKNLSVDIEYNRHGSDTKRLSLPPRRVSSEELRAVTVYPDIVVHQRNTDECNLLVLEMKKPHQKPKDVKYDRDKLLAFRNELGYLHAAHIIIGCVRGKLIREVEWIENQ